MDYLTTETARVLSISRDEAARRVSALFRTKIVDNGHYDDRESQLKIDRFLQIPSRKYEGVDLSKIG